jgi:catechol 2,3-dioxygenase-like lactoylglutathione lyase family enzyme
MASSLTSLGSRTVCQIGLVVRDVEQSARAYAELLGVDVPSCVLTAPEEKSHIRYRGQPTQGRAKIAFFQLDNLSLELIEPVGGPSAWQEFLETRGEGVHHIAFQISGMDEQIACLEAKGLPLLQRGDFTGGRYAYMDSASQLGVVLELLEIQPE